MTDLAGARVAMRTEYMRGLPDAYNGGPRGRELAWERLLVAIDTYANARDEYLRGLLDTSTAPAEMTAAPDAPSDQPPTLSTTPPLQHNDEPAAKASMKKTTTTRTRSRRRT